MTVESIKGVTWRPWWGLNERDLFYKENKEGDGYNELAVGLSIYQLPSLNFQ